MTGPGWAQIAMRWTSAVVALVLLPSIAPDLFDLGCPHHLGHADAEEHAHEAVHHGAAADHTSAGEHIPALAASPDAQDGSLPPPCTCVGSCPTSAGPSVPAGPAATTPAIQATVSARATPTLDRAPARRAPYTLPFANGPPLA